MNNFTLTPVSNTTMGNYEQEEELDDRDTVKNAIKTMTSKNFGSDRRYEFSNDLY